MDSKYLMIDKKVLPSIFEKVIEVKDILKMKKAEDVTEAVKMVGISRSAYYKYKDYVFTVSQAVKSSKVTVRLLIGHKAGTLSKILDIVASNRGNVLTINQDIPINNTANVTITFDIYYLKIELESLLNNISNLENVIKAEFIAIE